MRHSFKKLAAWSVAACMAWSLAVVPARAVTVRSAEPITNVNNIGAGEGKGVNFLPLLQKIEAEDGPLVELVSQNDPSKVYPLHLSAQQSGSQLSFDAPNIEYTSPGTYTYTLKWTFNNSPLFAMASNPITLTERVVDSGGSLRVERENSGFLELHLFDQDVSLDGRFNVALRIDAAEKAGREVSLSKGFTDGNRQNGLVGNRSYSNVASNRDIDISDLFDHTSVGFKTLFSYRDRSKNPVYGTDYIDVPIAFQLKLGAVVHEYLYESDASIYPTYHMTLRFKKDSVELLPASLPQTRFVLTNDLHHALALPENYVGTDPLDEQKLFDLLALPQLKVQLSGDKTIEENEFTLHVSYKAGSGDLGLSSVTNDAEGNFKLALPNDAKFGWAAYELKQSLTDPKSEAAQKGSYTLDDKSHYLMVISLPAPLDGAFYASSPTPKVMINSDGTERFTYYLYFDSIKTLEETAKSIYPPLPPSFYEKMSETTFNEMIRSGYSYADYEKVFAISPILANIQFQSESANIQSKASYSNRETDIYRQDFFFPMEIFLTGATRGATFANNYKLPHSAAPTTEVDAPKVVAETPKVPAAQPQLPKTSDIAATGLAFVLTSTGAAALILRKKFNS